MQSIKNERGAVIVFVTLIIVLLLVMVGMGLDTGHLAYVRSQGQPAVDAAALAAASAIPSGKWPTVTDQAAKFNPGGNPGPGNNYVSSPTNKITDKSVTLVKYDHTTGAITTSGVSIANANGARVALENNNPYGGTVGAAMTAPLFLTPLLNLLGATTPGTSNVSVSAVAVIQALPGLPIVVTQSLCGTNATLDFQSGGTAGWETYYIDNASTSEVRNLWNALPFCSGQPVVDTGYCGNVANGVNQTIVDANLKPMFKADPKACYLIPVVKTGGNFNQCQTITDWASFCPACKPNGDCTDAFPKTGQLQGTVTCGQSPWSSRDTKCYVPSLVRDTKSGM
jgi:Flp pilus assembly protein TadG